MRTSRKGKDPSSEGCSMVKVRSSVRELKKERWVSAWSLFLKAPHPSSTKWE